MAIKDILDTLNPIHYIFERIKAQMQFTEENSSKFNLIRLNSSQMESATKSTKVWQALQKAIRTAQS